VVARTPWRDLANCQARGTPAASRASARSPDAFDMLDRQMNGPAYALIGLALAVAVLATVAWSARYRRMPFHPQRPELAFRVLAIAASAAGAVVEVVFARPGEQTGLTMVLVILLLPAENRATMDFHAWRAAGGAVVGRAGRYQQKRQVECGLRIVDGAQVGLGTRFRHGLATLEPGAILFVPCLGGVRFLHGNPVRVSVVAVDRSDQRSVGWMEMFSARPGFRVIKVLTGVATLECVLQPEQTAWAAEQIRPQ
jgi:hypothetical protein